MSESTWTNSTIRKRLGECGFIQVKDRDDYYGSVAHTYWQRGSIMLQLAELPNTAPQLFDHYGNEISPENLGVRNDNTQTGNHP